MVVINTLSIIGTTILIIGRTMLVSTCTNNPSLVLLGYLLVDLWLLVLLIQSLVHVELCFLVLFCPSLVVLHVCGFISHIN